MSNKISHNRIKNTGIIYESLLRQITHEVMSGDNSTAVNILKKHFSKTELAKEYKLYQTLNNYSNLSESKADSILNSLISEYKKLNKTSLRNEKYNLIKEIKNSYDINEFFKYKLPNYKELAALCTLFEVSSQKDFIDPTISITHKSTLIESLTKSTKNEIEDKLFEEYLGMDTGMKMVIYRKLVEKFNKKYSGLSGEQKLILKEYINNGENLIKLKEFINKHQNIIKEKLSTLYYQVQDKTTQIKLNETISLLKPLTTVKDEDVISLMSYYELINELEKVIK